MTPTAIDAAAQHLVAARRKRQPGPRIPETCRPATVADALLIQRRVAAILEEPVGGWKCSLPTPEKTIVAPIYASTIQRSSPCRVPDRGGTASIEPEIAFVLGRDLPPRATPYTETEVRAAIAEVRLVLELMGCRYADPDAASFPEMLADSANDYGMYIGPVLAAGLDRALEAFPLTIGGPAGTVLAREGRHPDGHPLRPLVWLANWFGTNAAGWTQGLSAGQIVTTGSYAGALDVPVGLPLSIAYGDLGTLAVHLVPA